MEKSSCEMMLSRVLEALENFGPVKCRASVSLSTHSPQPEIGQAFCTVEEFKSAEEALARCREHLEKEGDALSLLYLNVADISCWRCGRSSYSQTHFSALRPVCEVKRVPGSPVPVLTDSLVFYIREGRGRDGRVDYESERPFANQAAALEYLKSVLLARTKGDSLLQTVAVYVGGALKGEEHLRFCRGRISFARSEM